MVERRSFGGAQGVEGLRGLSRAARAVAENSSRLAKQAAVEASADLISEAQSNAAALGAGYSRAAATLRAFATVQGAGVMGGSAQVPDFGGWEYGAAHDVPRQRVSGTYRGLNQFPVWSGSGDDAGYFVWPAMRHLGADDAERYVQALERLINSELGVTGAGT